MVGPGIVAAFIAMSLFSIGDTLAKTAASSLGGRRTALYIVSSGVLPVFVMYAMFPPATLTAWLLGFNIVSGLLLAAGYLLVYESLKSEQASTTWALISISPVALIIFGVYFLSESVNYLQASCIALILVGVLLITMKGMRFNVRMLPALLGNVCFAGFILMAAYGISYYNGDFSLFFFIPRIFSVAIFAAYGVYASRSAPKPDKHTKFNVSRAKIAAIASGLFDGCAQVAYAFMILLGPVAIGAAITASEPMLVMALAHIFYRERVVLIQYAGIAMSVLGAVLISFV